MSFMGKTLSQLEAPLSTLDWFLPAVISSLLLVSHSGNHLSLYVHCVVMFLFLLNPGEFDVETLSVG